VQFKRKRKPRQNSFKTSPTINRLTTSHEKAGIRLALGTKPAFLLLAPCVEQLEKHHHYLQEPHDSDSTDAIGQSLEQALRRGPTPAGEQLEHCPFSHCLRDSVDRLR
jgi:hypothetical protein